MLLLLMITKACTSSPFSSSKPPLHLLCLLPMLSSSFSWSLFGPPPPFTPPSFSSSFPFLFCFVLPLLFLALPAFCYLNHTRLSVILGVCASTLCLLLLLLLLLLVVMNETDCMAGAESQVYIGLLCHCSNFRPGYLIFSSSSSSLSLGQVAKQHSCLSLQCLQSCPIHVSAVLPGN